MQRKCVTPLRDAVKRRKEEKEECSAGWEKLVWVENFLVGSTTAGGKTAEREQVGKKSAKKRSGSPRDELRVTITRNRGGPCRERVLLGNFFLGKSRKNPRRGKSQQICLQNKQPHHQQQQQHLTVCRRHRLRRVSTLQPR